MRTSNSCRNMLLLLFILIVFAQVECEVDISSGQTTLEVGEAVNVEVEITNVPEQYLNRSVSFVVEQESIANVLNSPPYTSNGDNWVYNVKIEALKAGKSGLSVTVVSPRLEIDQAFLLIKVHKNKALDWLSTTIGWCYFLSWSLSFYPQLLSNYTRKSVVGLNFDFLLFNIFGYLMYNIFNLGVFFIPLIKDQYSIRHPKSLNPIRPNDVFFSAHGFLATLVTIGQCIAYERANQRVSLTAKIVIQIYIATVAISAILAIMSTIWWLDVLYICSYIKLCVTITKYVPQMYMNYQRKSTRGWSVGSVSLDLLGGLLSVFQMILDGYNYDDWNIFIENPTKFGLGILSNGFCLTFLVQHYILYPDQTKNADLELKSVSTR